jgi:hypothetical protein
MSNTIDTEIDISYSRINFNWDIDGNHCLINIVKCKGKFCFNILTFKPPTGTSILKICRDTKFLVSKNNEKINTGNDKQLILAKDEDCDWELMNTDPDSFEESGTNFSLIVVPNSQDDKEI